MMSCHMRFIVRAQKDEAQNPNHRSFMCDVKCDRFRSIPASLLGKHSRKRSGMKSNISCGLAYMYKREKKHTYMYTCKQAHMHTPPHTYATKEKNFFYNLATSHKLRKPMSISAQICPVEQPYRR